MEFLSMARLMLYSVLFFYLIFLNCFYDLRCNGQLLPEEEVQALQTIAEKLQLKNFNFNQSFCSSGEVRNSTSRNDIVTDFICNPCNATFCHVTNIVLKGQNLSGTFPEEFGNLSYLQQIDLTRNYISGSLPTTLDRIPLTNLSLLGNRINGSIPKEIGNIATLLELVLEDNDLVGTLPENLGNLSSLKRMLLSANNFTGTIPDSFGKLTNLTDFRIDGNRISGTIPDFIGNWTKITRLDLQGTLLDGPFPSNISAMTNMSELRILNLNATAIKFPDLSQMKQLSYLILRNCGLTGPIPDYLGGFTGLKQLDLSYNMFTGQIPQSLSKSINYLFLNNNSLSGSVPSWILNNNQNFYDLSYNNFSGLSSGNCQASSLNLVSSTSPTESNSVSWCLTQDLSCSSKPQYYSLFINCGGNKLPYDGNEYEEDKSIRGPAYFAASGDKWAYSSNGLYNGNSSATYIATNLFGLNITGGDIYNTARLAPNAIKYYGLCMRQGSYKVQLHFAEIMFSDDQTFSSIGKRIFDVAIQGNVVLKDFNIAEAADGVGKGITKEFRDIRVTGSTLEIDLYWTGKGTNAIPFRGVYGPLISAITVTPNFHVSDGLSAGAIAGIVIASCVVLLALILLVLWKLGFIGKDHRDKELEAQIELHTGYFTLRQIKQATSNFDPANKIGEGGFGPVYKGVLSDGTVIAVKQLSSKSKQGNREFVNEIGMISALQHPNLVKLYGCCIEGNQLLLVYEYMENNSLARTLFGRDEPRLRLDWPTRKRVCIGIAKGLFYLHEESRLKIVHRDIKATNVLLDKDLNAKISDFGLAKLDEEENTHISTRIAGTIGYMAPEYAMRGYLTDKADVYSFGIVALEIVSGKSNTNYRPKEEFVYLLDWAYVLQEQGSLLELVDPILGSKYSRKEAMSMLEIALLCTNPSPTLRPSMSSVVSMLEGKTPIQAPLIKRNSPNRELRFKAFEMLSQDSETNVSAFSQESHERRTTSMDGPWIDSSVSSQNGFVDQSSTSRLIPDLLDVNLN